MSSLDLIQQIKTFLPDATETQLEQFSTEVKRLEQLEAYFQTYPEDRVAYEDRFFRAKKALDYKRPYRIAVIGRPGTGKSTMINVMLAQDLVLTKAVGAPATGAALQIFFDVSEHGQEVAEIEYRDESNIRRLMTNFTEQYNLDVTGLSGELTAFTQLQPPDNFNDQMRTEFLILRDTLLDIAYQYTNTDINILPKTFNLSDPEEKRKLATLIDENPSDSNSRFPKVTSLIKTVTYRIKPLKGLNGTTSLQLPHNVCLLDLPGLDGTPLHDIIIGEGIQEADAVIFILRPTRVSVRGDVDLLNRTRKYVSVEGNVHSGDRIFVVVNARDEPMVDSTNPLTDLQQQMHQFMERLVPNYTSDPKLRHRGGDYPYFLTSAYAAYAAQRRLKGEPLAQETNTYEATKLKLGVQGQDDGQVLQASQVPQLVKALTEFAREQRIAGQIRDGRSALNEIIETLYSRHKKDCEHRLERKGGTSIESKAKEKLMEDSQKLEQCVYIFRETVLQKFDSWQQQLGREAKNLCQEIDQSLKRKMPEIWRRGFYAQLDPIYGGVSGEIGYRQVLQETQAELWEQLTRVVPKLVDPLVELYRDELNSSRLTQRIVDRAYGYSNIVDLNQLIEDRLRTKMMSSLSDVAERIALVMAAEPAKGLLPPTPDSSSSPNQFRQKLEQLPRHPELPIDAFNHYIAAVHQQYEPIVTDFCVRALLNIHRFEMLHLENALREYIRSIFNSIPSTDVSALGQEMMQADPDWQLIYKLERKLERLSALRR